MNLDSVIYTRKIQLLVYVMKPQHLTYCINQSKILFLAEAI
jgi:hypothetical protein